MIASVASLPEPAIEPLNQLTIETKTTAAEVTRAENMNCSIRRSYLAITMENVAMCMCPQTLMEWIELFDTSEPRSDAELFYAESMLNVISRRLCLLNLQ